jgi:integrase
MTERQKGTAITWEDLMAARKANPDNLLLGFYTYLPPVRADYNAVHLLKPTDPIPENSNYIVLGTDYKVVLQEFKTAKTYKTIEHRLPEPLKKILDKSLKEQPRKYLFTLESGEPMTPNYFSAWAGRQLTKLIGKKTNLTAIRHAFVHNLDYNGPLRDLKSITDSMGHSVERSMLYKLKGK